MKPVFTLFFLANSILSISQLKIDTSNSVDYYVKHVLLGEGVEVANIKYTGMVVGIGEFEGDSELIGVERGIVLSTGDVFDVGGPNNQRGKSGIGVLPNSRRLINKIRKGDSDLNKLTGGRAKDMSLIEFDFIPKKNVLEFNYVFASEEYPEFVNSRYNDAFGFFISGPGIKKRVNLAVLDDGKTPISINTINHKKNKKLYRRNYTVIGPIKRIFRTKKVGKSATLYRVSLKWWAISSYTL